MSTLTDWRLLLNLSTGQEHKLRQPDANLLMRVFTTEFADAGFYYLGDRDGVKCLYCNGCLKNWQPTDDPFQEHAE